MKRFLPTLLVVLCLVQKAICQLPKSGLDIWLKADAGVNLNGNGVIAWNDQSGNGHHALVTPSLSSPQLVANELNGRPVIRFNGIDNGLQTDTLTTFPQKRGTLFIVFRINGLGSKAGAGYGTLLSTYFGKKVTWQLGESAEVYGFYDGEGTGFPFSACREKKWEVAGLVRTNDTMFNFYRMGRLQTEFNVKSNQPDANTIKIGSNGRLEVLNGDIAEIIIYNRSLKNDEVGQVNNYLLTKYQLKAPPLPFNETVWYYVLWVTAIVVLTAFTTKIFLHRKLKEKLREAERKMELEKERQRISREMHDDIGAGLTQISLMSEAAKRNNTSTLELEDIANTSRQLVSNMSEIIWSLNTENKTLEQLSAYLREQLNKQLEYANIKYSINLPEATTFIVLGNQQKRNIILVTKEVVNNAIKYSHASHISVSMKICNNELFFEVVDDGIGFDTTKNFQGNGLRNIKHRIEELNGKLLVQSSSLGTNFAYSIPLK